MGMIELPKLTPVLSRQIKEVSKMEFISKKLDESFIMGG
jgi:hypothetical protein